MQRLPTVRILGIDVARAAVPDALAEIEALADGEAPALIFYVNAHTLNLAARDPSYRAVLQAASLVLNDGSGVSLAGRMRGVTFPANLNGSDLNPKILELCAARRWSVFFLGGEPGVAGAAAARLGARIEGLRVAGTRSGFFPRSEDAEVAAEIAATGADVVMVAMGNPSQERWLAANLSATGCRMGTGVGAFFDFEAGRVARSPAWMTRWGIEWVWRLSREPGRMWRRYVLGNPLFLVRALRTARSERRL